MDESKLVYARLAELASQLHKPEAMAELRRLGAIHKWEFDRLPLWIKEAAGLKDAGMTPDKSGQ
jgi:hypothetical protein